MRQNFHEVRKGTLAAAQVDIDFLLLVFLGNGTLNDIGLKRAVLVEPAGNGSR